MVKAGGLVDAMFFQAGQVATIAIQAATSLVLLRALGHEMLGLYAVSTAMAAAAVLLDFSGSGRVALVDIARATGAGTPEVARHALARFLRVSTMVRVPIVLTFFVVAPSVAAGLYGSREAGLLARWLCVPLAIDIPFDLLVTLLQARRFTRDLVRVEVTRVLAISLGTIGVLIGGWRLTGIVVVQVTTSLVSAVWATWRYAAVARQDGALPAWPALVREARSADARPRLRAGVSMAIEKNVSNFAGQLPVLLLGAFRPAEVGFFSAALRVISLPYPLVSALARHLDVLLPVRSGESVRALRQAFIAATVTAAAMWTAVTAVMVAAAPVLLIWLGGDAYAPAVPVVHALVLQSLATGAGVAIGAALRALDRPGVGIALQIVSIAVSLPVGYVLIRESGATGAAWFHSIRYAVLTAVGVTTTIRLLKRRQANPAPALTV